MAAWGFQYKSNIVWHKIRKDGGSDGRGVGFYFRNVTELVLFGVPGIIMLAVQLAAMPVMAAGVINGLGHAVGYRNFECDNAARNLVPWGLLSGGEELHNNHHAFPSSARFSIRPWEFDIGWACLRVLSCVCLQAGL